MNTNREREVQRERGREREGERGRERGGERGREREGEREKKEEANKFWDQQTVFKRICPHGAKTIRNHPPSHFLEAHYVELPVTMATLVRSNLCYGAPL